MLSSASHDPTIGLPRLTLRRRRESIVSGLEPISMWPQPHPDDIRAMGERSREFLIKKQALGMYVACEREKDIIAQVKRDHGYKFRQGELLSLLESCLKVERSTGLMRGLWAFAKEYRGGVSQKPRGELGKLFAAHPDIEEKLLKFVRTREVDGQKAAVVTAGLVHSAFLAFCKEKGLKHARLWPYSDSARHGYEAVRRWAQKVQRAHPSETARNTLGDTPGSGVARDRDRVEQSRIARAVAQAYSLVELDEHRFDGMFVIRIKLANGSWHEIETTRIWILALIETASHAVLAVTVSYSERYDRYDVMRLVHRALRAPPRLGRLVLQSGEFGYDEGACFPGELPEFSGNSWQELAFDGDASHKSLETRAAIEAATGGLVTTDARGDPTARPNIEGLFADVTRLAQALPNATGNEPSSPARRDPEAAARRLCFDADLVEEVVDVYFRNRNVSAKKALLGLSPIQKLRQMKAEGAFYRAPLGELGKWNLHHLLPWFPATLTQRRHKHGVLQVECRYGRYSSRALDAASADLWFAADKSVRIYPEQDARFATVVPNAFPERVYPVVLHNAPWRYVPHTLEVRVLSERSSTASVGKSRANAHQLSVGVLQALAAHAKTNQRAADVARRQIAAGNRSAAGELHPYGMSREQQKALLKELESLDAMVEPGSAEPVQEAEQGGAPLPARPAPVAVAHAAAAPPPSVTVRRNPRDDDMDLL